MIARTLLKKKLSEFTKLQLIKALDKYWARWVEGVDMEGLIDGYFYCLRHGQKGYYDLTKPQLIQYIIRNYEENDDLKLLDTIDVDWEDWEE